MRSAIAAAACVVASPVLAGPAGTLYGISGQAGDRAVLYEIDPLTGAATAVLTLNADGGFLMGLTSLNGELYATNLADYPGGPASGFSLGRIDMNTGEVTFVSDLNGLFNVQGLASNESEGIFYGIDTVQRELLTITTSGAITSVGATVPDGRGLAYDDTNAILYGVSLDDNLYAINPLTAASSLIGQVAIPGPGLDWTGLAFDESTGSLLMIEGVAGNLWSLNTATAEATLIGSNGVTGITGLAWAIPAPGTLLTIAVPLALASRRRRG